MFAVISSNEFNSDKGFREYESLSTLSWSKNTMNIRMIISEDIFHEAVTTGN